MIKKIFKILIYIIIPFNLLPEILLAEISSTTFKAEIAFPLLQLELPVFLASPPGGSKWIFVCEQGGKIKAFVDTVEVDRYRTILDITPQVKNDRLLEGLLSMAFHPKFAKNRLIYIAYMADKPRRLILSEFKLKALSHVADSKSERLILTVKQPSGTNNGGMIGFGPDGFLYISIGDTQEFQSVIESDLQDLQKGNLSASILRIDIDHPSGGRPYSVPPDNPFIAETGQRSEVWAFGLRNVFRFSFDQKTGELWATDNGPKNWEEMNIVKKGGNYGWDFREGRHPAESEKGTASSPNLIDPILEYSHSEGEFIVGGGIYRGKKFPELEGRFLFGDLMKGKICAAERNEDETFELRYLTYTPTVSSFLVGRNGQVYMTSYYGGKIYSLKSTQP